MIPAVCQPSSPPPSPATERLSFKENAASSEEVSLRDDTCPNCREELHLVATRRKFTAEEEQLFQEQIRTKQNQLIQLQDDITKTKKSMQGLVEMKAMLAVLWGKVLTQRLKVQLVKRACEEGERQLQKEVEELQMLDRANKRRSEHLKYVQSKNFPQREVTLKSSIEKDREACRKSLSNLEASRKTFITDVYRQVFPIEVLPLSHEDQGAEDYEAQIKIDCDQLLEVDEGWILGGVHRHPTPHISIVCPSLPASGDHTPYLMALRDRRKHKEDEPMVQVHPTSDPYQSTPAALVYIAHFVEVIAWVLDQPLPFPIHRPEAISEHGFLVKRKRSFQTTMAKLDDNIMYLCFTQGVPLTALAVGHTLQNLLALVTHIQLGRSGAFECHPELMSFKPSGPASKRSKDSGDVDDSQPPNISYAANTLSQGEESDSDEWEEEEEMSLKSMPDIDDADWEDVDLSPREALMFEEEMKAALKQQGGGVSSESQEFSEYRVLRLDYDSTYADFSSSMASMGSGRKLQASSAKSAGLLDSQSKTEQQAQKTAESKESEPSSGVAASLFGTLSGLWSSTFGSK